MHMSQYTFALGLYIRPCLCYLSSTYNEDENAHWWDHKRDGLTTGRRGKNIAAPSSVDDRIFMGGMVDLTGKVATHLCHANELYLN